LDERFVSDGGRLESPDCKRNLDHCF
jgi:hypothetical protein